jgi:hypothetical protein
MATQNLRYLGKGNELSYQFVTNKEPPFRMKPGTAIIAARGGAR